MIVKTDEKNYQDIADAIRSKNGSDATYLPSEMAGAIGALPNPPQFGAIGWDSDDMIAYDAQLAGDIAYSKELYDAWNASATNIGQRFKDDRRIVYFPFVFFSKITSMSYTFWNCYCLQYFPQLDTSSVIDMNATFINCKSLRSIPQLDTSSVKNMDATFYGCDSLRNIPQLDTSSVTVISYAFASCKSLVNLGGFKNLKVALDLSPCTLLTHQSLMNVINNLYDLSANGLSAQTLTLGATNLAKLTDEEKAVASNKGWTLA